MTAIARSAASLAVFICLGALAAPAVAQKSGPWSDDLAQARPICCGALCGVGRPCCAGTVCSQSGRCIPEVCMECGAPGCAVDYDACTASCVPAPVAIPAEPPPTTIVPPRVTVPVPNAQQPTAASCCGATCGPGQPCCAGTVCSQGGRCVPMECGECGDRGCDVDYATCTASCGPISCCLNTCLSNADCCTDTVCLPTSGGIRQCVPATCSSCTSQGRPCEVTAQCEPVCGLPTCCRSRCNRDSDCCEGTTCMPVTSGENLCVPNICETCSGMHPHCDVSDSCEGECIGPPSCGNPCTANADCGVGSVCQLFGTQRMCVPGAFETECAACPGSGCAFLAGSCAVDCN